MRSFAPNADFGTNRGAADAVLTKVLRSIETFPGGSRRRRTHIYDISRIRAGGREYNGSVPTGKLLCASLFVASLCTADVRLPNLIGDHMLLQRDAPVRIFGKASPGEAVSVTFRGQTVKTSSNPLGRWEVWLQPMKPGAPEEMTIQGNNTVKVADVLVGDVWVGSGQSNMQWAVKQTTNAAAEIGSAKFPEIRLFYVPRKGSPVPVEDVEAKWVVCTPETVGDFSAVLFYFGRQLH